MFRKAIVSYGAWPSPITAERVAEARLNCNQLTATDDEVYWVESRSQETGRHAVMRCDARGRVEEVVRAPFSARTRVYEYGGGSYCVTRDGVVFANFEDQRLYRAGRDGSVRTLSPAEDFRFADFRLDGRRARLVCVREDYRGGARYPAVSIVAVDLARGGPGYTLVEGCDFYASPRLSPDGSRMAWLAWNHPSMPWDSAELWVAAVRADGTLGSPQHVAGGATESVCQPEWSPDGVLHFVSDRTNWWNLYRHRDGGAEALATMDAEFASPQWVLGASLYDFLDARRIVCAYTYGGFWHLAVLDGQRGRLTPLATPFTWISNVRACRGQAVFVGGAWNAAERVVKLDVNTGRRETLRSAPDMKIDPGYLARPRPIAYASADGHTAHAHFYPPTHPQCNAPPGAKPPLVVKVHGGPTGFTSHAYRLDFQYYTSRGIAVLDAHYGGTTGYGRAYRERLYSRWGEIDVEDCVRAAQHAANAGWVDGRRMAIAGSSAGGFTALAALTFHDVFAAGASHFGISDLERFASETHKFESRYCDILIGPLPEARATYRARSPLWHAEHVHVPVIFFQGREDRVTPSNQSESMAQALRALAVPVAYIDFSGESHGFGRAETIRRVVEAELDFLARALGFALAEPLESVTIQDFPAPPEAREQTADRVDRVPEPMPIRSEVPP